MDTILEILETIKPGTICDIRIKEGDRVTKNMPLMVIEAMSIRTHPNLLDLILGHQIDLIIDTPSQGIERSKDGFVIRRHAVETGVNCLTSLDTANALLTSLESSCREDLSLVDIAEIDKEIESKINEA